MMLCNCKNSWLENTVSYDYKKCHASLKGKRKQNIKYLANTVIQQITRPPWGRTHVFLWYPLNTSIGLNIQEEGKRGTYFSAPKRLCHFIDALVSTVANK